jgi:hypothetical protein
MNAARAKRFRREAIFFAATTLKSERTAAVSSDNVHRRSVPADATASFRRVKIDPASMLRHRIERKT